LRRQPAKPWDRARDRLSGRVAAGLPSQGSGHTDAKRDRRKGEQDSFAEPWPLAPGLVKFQGGWVDSNHLDKFFDRQRASGNLGWWGARHGTYPHL
jgi:hypothetical protein